MNVLAILRPENKTFVEELCYQKHNVWMPRTAAVFFRKFNLPIQPVDWPEREPDSIDIALARPIRRQVLDALPLYKSMVDETIYLHTNEGIDAIVVWTDAPGAERCLVRVGQSLGIPTFELTHGCFNTYRQGHFECESFVDCILAPGQHEVDFREFYGNKNRIEIVGKPSWDWIQPCPIQQYRKVVRENLKIPLDRPLILYAMTWRHPFSVWERDENWGIDTVLEAHMNLQDICKPYLLIKPHYATCSDAVVNRITNICDKMEITDYSVSSMDPMFLLPAVDLVVSHKSSILIESLLLDIPCVGFDFRKINDFRFYDKRGIYWVEDPEELVVAMTKCLLDYPTKQRLAEERKTAKHYFNGPCDGRATQRAVAVMHSIAASRKQKAVSV